MRIREAISGDAEAIRNVHYQSIKELGTEVDTEEQVNYVIAGLDEPHGLALKEELEDYDTEEIHHNLLNPNLDTLVEKGQRDG